MSEMNFRVRLVIIKDNKLLLTYTPDGDFYFYLGGHVEFGETIKETAIREVKEECGREINFEFKKLLYIREFFNKEKTEHSLEFFVLGDIDKTEGVEEIIDEEHPEQKRMWVDINNLPENLLPKSLSKKLVNDYKSGFPKEGEYLGAI